MAWYPFLGFGVFWLGLIAAIIIYIKKRKFYPLIYLISVALYIFTVGFVIDVFNFSRNSILLTLAFSAALFIFAGIFISKKASIQVKKAGIQRVSYMKVVLGIILPLAVIVALTLLSNSSIGLSIKFDPVESITFNDLFASSSADYGRVVLAKLTIKNDFFLSRRVEVNTYEACFYSTKTETASNRKEYLSYNSLASPQYTGDIFSSGYYPINEQDIQIKSNDQKEVELSIQKKYDYSGDQRNYYINYDKILLFKNDRNRYEYDFCSKVSKEDIRNAVSIDVKERSFQITNQPVPQIPPRPVPEKIKPFE
ncbi:hypothetical protein HYX19_03420 [Candidatus Woesearchaeota archaeon]|nr:hypothetical protein [Candidatus Woesearchaeota archaeon]